MKQRLNNFIIFSFLSFIMGCATVKTEPPISYVPFKTLPIKGKLIAGDLDNLPQSIKKSIDENSSCSFRYSEIKSFDESHVPNILSLFVLAPFHLLGAPLGTKKCMVTAMFEIIDEGDIFKSYSAKSSSFNYYGFYYGAQFIELEEMACYEVRLCIDEMISNDHEFLKNLKY